MTLRSRCWYLQLTPDGLAADPVLLTMVEGLQKDIFTYTQAKLDLSSLIKKYEDCGVDEVLMALQYLSHDFVVRRLCGQSHLQYDIAFQVSLPLTFWWAFWEKLLHYRSIYRTQTSLNTSLLLADLLLILRGIVPPLKVYYEDITFS